MLNLNIIREPINQTWSVEQIANERPPRTWEHVFEDAKPELHDVSIILDEQERTYGAYIPLKKDIFNAFCYTPLPNVKVVIIGQDPYHQMISVNGVSMPRAVGLSFSVRQEDSIPSSLQNIYIELANTVRGFHKPDHGDLREWAQQGVLLLNTCLTVRQGAPGSHGDIWLGFVNKVFKAIAAVNPNCIFMLWGREAQKLKPMLGERSIILEAAHPSGLSARRGFFGCNHFNLANDFLIKQGKIGINWKISTLAELRSPTAIPVPNNCIPIPNNSIPQTNRATAVVQAHKPMLAPVNVDLLPSIIPLKPVVNTGIPTIIGIPQAKPPEQPVSIIHQIPNVPTMTLPIITNNKAIGVTTPIMPVVANTPKSPTRSKTSSPKDTGPNTPPTGVPTIPTITFGANLTSNTVIPLSNMQQLPQIIAPSPKIITPPTRQQASPLIGLPIIPVMVH